MFKNNLTRNMKVQKNSIHWTNGKQRMHLKKRFPFNESYVIKKKLQKTGKYMYTTFFFYFSTSHVMISSIFTNFFLVSEENVVITLQKAHCYSTLSLRKRHYVHLFLLFQLTEEEEASSVNEGCYNSALFVTLSWHFPWVLEKN